MQHPQEYSRTNQTELSSQSSSEAPRLVGEAPRSGGQSSSEAQGRGSDPQLDPTANLPGKAPSVPPTPREYVSPEVLNGQWTNNGRFTVRVSSSEDSSRAASRPLLSSTMKKKKRVSFPQGEALIKGYAHAPNPSYNVINCTTENLVTAYIHSCEKHATKPLTRLLLQLKSFQQFGTRMGQLNLRGENLNAKHVEPLEEVFKRLKFRTIDLEGAHLDDESATAIFEMVEHYEAAELLKIGYNKDISVRGWMACSRMIRKTPCLEELNTRGVTFSDQSLPALGRALRMGAFISVLHMEECSLSCRGMMVLAAALRGQEGVREVYVGNNNLQPPDGIQIGNLLRNNTHLEVLDLRNNHLEDSGVTHLCEGLREQTGPKGLKSLILHNNRLTCHSMPALSRALAHVTSLQSLSLSSNSLTNEGIFRLKDGLLQNKSLSHLHLHSAKLSCEGAVALAEFIADSARIKVVDLRDNEVKTAGLMALSMCIKVHQTVVEMHLDPNPKREQGVKDYANQQKLFQEVIQAQLVANREVTAAREVKAREAAAEAARAAAQAAREEEERLKAEAKAALSTNVETMGKDADDVGVDVIKALTFDDNDSEAGSAPADSAQAAEREEAWKLHDTPPVAHFSDSFYSEGTSASGGDAGSTTVRGDLSVSGAANSSAALGYRATLLYKGPKSDWFADEQSVDESGSPNADQSQPTAAVDLSQSGDSLQKAAPDQLVSDEAVTGSGLSATGGGELGSHTVQVDADTSLPDSPSDIFTADRPLQSLPHSETSTRSVSQLSAESETLIIPPAGASTISDLSTNSDPVPTAQQQGEPAEVVAGDASSQQVNADSSAVALSDEGEVHLTDEPANVSAPSTKSKDLEDTTSGVKLQDRTESSLLPTTSANNELEDVLSDGVGPENLSEQLNWFESETPSQSHSQSAADEENASLENFVHLSPGLTSDDSQPDILPDAVKTTVTLITSASEEVCSAKGAGLAQQTEPNLTAAHLGSAEVSVDTEITTSALADPVNTSASVDLVTDSIFDDSVSPSAQEDLLSMSPQEDPMSSSTHENPVSLGSQEDILSTNTRGNSEELLDLTSSDRGLGSPVVPSIEGAQNSFLFASETDPFSSAQPSHSSGLATSGQRPGDFLGMLDSVLNEDCSASPLDPTPLSDDGALGALSGFSDDFYVSESRPGGNPAASTDIDMMLGDGGSVSEQKDAEPVSTTTLNSAPEPSQPLESGGLTVHTAPLLDVGGDTLDDPMDSEPMETTLHDGTTTMAPSAGLPVAATTSGDDLLRLDADQPLVAPSGEEVTSPDNDSLASDLLPSGHTEAFLKPNPSSVETADESSGSSSFVDLLELEDSSVNVGGHGPDRPADTVGSHSGSVSTNSDDLLGDFM